LVLLDVTRNWACSNIVRNSPILNLSEEEEENNTLEVQVSISLPSSTKYPTNLAEKVLEEEEEEDKMPKGCSRRHSLCILRLQL